LKSTINFFTIEKFQSTNLDIEETFMLLSFMNLWKSSSSPLWRFQFLFLLSYVLHWICNLKVVFGWIDLREFTIQEDGFEGMKVVWLTWFGRMDAERFTGWSSLIWRNLQGFEGMKIKIMK